MHSTILDLIQFSYTQYVTTQTKLLINSITLSLRFASFLTSFQKWFFKRKKVQPTKTSVAPAIYVFKL